METETTTNDGTTMPPLGLDETHLTADECPGCGARIAVPTEAIGASWRSMTEDEYASLWCPSCGGTAPFLDDRPGA